LFKAADIEDLRLRIAKPDPQPVRKDKTMARGSKPGDRR